MHIPQLPSGLAQPVVRLEESIVRSQSGIEHWFRSQWQEHEVPFYASVDLRNSGFKLAPVDTNLFPGGFNNLNPDLMPVCVHAAMVAVQKLCPEARGALIIPENHTRNLHYLKNVAALAQIVKLAGMNVRIGSLLPEVTAPTEVALPDGGKLVLEPLVRSGNRVGLADFDPCVILLNNDLSGGVPPILKGLEQQVLPPMFAGWFARRKSRHFAAYDRVAAQFAELIDIDPWLINPYFATCGEINFQEKQGEECLASHVERILGDIGRRYREYGIERDPFVIVKADAGTYGMGIMTVKDPADVRGLNRKQRNKMSVVKEGLNVTEALVQEGVYTFESVGEAVAEPVIYMIDQFVVGGFYRVHTGRGPDENLNAPGMGFAPLAFDVNCLLPNPEGGAGCAENRLYAYGVIARLALLAASLEIEGMAADLEAAPAAPARHLVGA